MKKKSLERLMQLRQYVEMLQSHQNFFSDVDRIIARATKDNLIDRIILDETDQKGEDLFQQSNGHPEGGPSDKDQGEVS